MHFLVVSQRAKGNPNFRLNDLPGHGRFDVICRVILSGITKLQDNGETKVTCFLKGSEPFGWLTVSSSNFTENHDEISLAAELQRNWTEYWHEGSLADLFSQTCESSELTMFELSEHGTSIDGLNSGGSINSAKMIVLLGAQRDLTDEDNVIVKKYPFQQISLGDEPLLASQAISIFRLFLFKPRKLQH